MAIRKLVPLTGLVSVVLVVAAFAAAGSTPTAHAPVATIVSFYSSHSTGQTVSGVLLGLGALGFLIFSASLGSSLRDADGEPGFAAALYRSGAVMLVIGLGLYAGLGIAIADVVHHVDGSTLQTLNVLADGAPFVFLITIGTSAFLLGVGMAVFETAVLPRWLGWLAIVFAIVAAVPSDVLGGTLDHIGFFAFGGLGLWSAIVGVLLARRA